MQLLLSTIATNYYLYIYSYVYIVIICIGKTCSARILQWINNLKEWYNYQQGSAKVIITSFMMLVYPLKYPSNACLSCLDNSLFMLESNLFGVSNCHWCLTSKQVSYQNKHSNTSQITSIADIPLYKYSYLPLVLYRECKVAS